MTDVQDTLTTQDTQTTSAERPTPEVQPTSSDQAASTTASTPNAPGFTDEATPLDDLIASIRAAITPGASVEARAVGATTCRLILAALEAKAGQPLTPAPATATPPAAGSATSPLAAMLTQLAAMPREQMLESITNFLRSKLPPGTQTQPTAGPRFHLIQLPELRPRGS